MTISIATVSAITLTFYLGASQAAPSDLRVRQSDAGNDAVMHEVPWQAFPFRFSPYYGIRLTYEPPGSSRLALMLDYTHFKVYAPTNDDVRQTGQWHGAPIDETAPMKSRVQSFEITHGANMLGLTATERFSAATGGVYAGVGPVLMVPHSESRVDGKPGGNVLEFGGAGWQVAGGAQQCVGVKRVRAELKYSDSGARTTIADGYATTNLRTVHELAGFDFGHCSRE